MNDLFFHPKVVHFPIALAVLLPVLAGGVLVAWWRGWLVPNTWWLVVAAHALLVASAFVALNTGEAQEERVEKVVPESALEAHEEAAETFAWTSAGLLLLTLAGGVLSRRKQGLVVAAVATLGTVVITVLGFEVGHEGGELVYEHGAAQVYGTPAGGKEPGAPTGGEHDDDDD